MFPDQLWSPPSFYRVTGSKVWPGRDAGHSIKCEGQEWVDAILLCPLAHAWRSGTVLPFTLEVCFLLHAIHVTHILLLVVNYFQVAYGREWTCIVLFTDYTNITTVIGELDRPNTSTIVAGRKVGGLLLSRTPSQTFRNAVLNVLEICRYTVLTNGCRMQSPNMPLISWRMEILQTDDNRRTGKKDTVFIDFLFKI
jgi:hypothetical protein